MTMPANLKKRLLTGSALLLSFAGILLIDSQFHFFFPCLMVCIGLAIVLASIEMQALMPLGRPRLFPLVMMTLLTVLTFSSPAVQFQGPWSGNPHFR